MIHLVLLSIAPLCAQSPAATTPSDQALTRVVETHLRWLGGRDAWATVRDITLDGTVVTHGLDGTLRLVAAHPGHVRSEIDLGAMRETTVLGPDGAFKLNLSGQVEPLPADERAGLAAQGVRLLNVPWLGDPTLRLELRPSETRDERTWSVVRLHHPGEIAIDVFLDADDGGLGWTRQARARGATTWTQFADWRLVDGVRVSFAQTTSLDDGSESARVTWKDVKLNAGVAAATFARPTAKGTRLATFAAGATSTEWLPMTLHLERYIYLRGTLNGHATDIVLDSGAGATVIDAALADQLQLATDGQITARGVGGTQPASFLADIAIEVGGLTLRGIRAVKIDLSGVGAMLGRGMPVILGKEAFHAAVIDIDYPNSRIAFRTATEFAYDGEGTTVRLVAGGDGHRQVEVTLEDGHKGLCTVDTGSGGTIAVFQAFVDRHDLLAGRTPLSETESGGVGGRIRSKLGTLRSLTFAGHELRDVPATFGADKRGGAFDDDRLLGNLGAGIFSRFRMIFDYSRDALHVEPTPDWQTRAFRKDRLGLACQWQDGALVVVFVPPGSPAARAGLTIGTRIVAIEGKRVPADGWREALLGHTRVDAGTEVTIATADEREVVLVAADYY